MLCDSLVSLVSTFIYFNELTKDNEDFCIFGIQNGCHAIMAYSNQSYSVLIVEIVMVCALHI